MGLYILVCIKSILQITVRMHNIVDDLAISEGIYSLVRRVEETATSISTTLKVWSARMEDRRQLGQMSNRLLADIGLSSSEVAVEVNKYFWQK